MGYLDHVMRPESQGIERRSVAPSRELIKCAPGNVVPEVPRQSPLSGSLAVEQIDYFHRLWASRTQGCVIASGLCSPSTGQDSSRSAGFMTWLVYSLPSYRQKL